MRVELQIYLCRLFKKGLTAEIKERVSSPTQLRTIFWAMMTNSDRSARGPNSIKFIDYLSLLHDNNAAQQYATCPSPLLRWQFSRLRPQQTTDLLALGTNGSKHRGGFKVVWDIRFLLPPCSRPLTFPNKQIPSSGRKARLVKLGCDRPAAGAFNEWNTLYMYPKGKSPSSTNRVNFADIWNKPWQLWAGFSPVRPFVTVLSSGAYQTVADEGNCEVWRRF